MQLSKVEFNAMNGSLRAFFQRHVEFPIFVRHGLSAAAGRDVVELGCGNGLGGELIARLAPRSYFGLDVMPEQIALANQRNLPGARFVVGDAAAIARPDASADVVVVFGILHHVERWAMAIAECRRVLRPGGLLLLEEPDGSTIRWWDKIFHWGHPDSNFSLAALERELNAGGLRLEWRFKVPGFFGVFRARRVED